MVEWKLEDMDRQLHARRRILGPPLGLLLLAGAAAAAEPAKTPAVPAAPRNAEARRRDLRSLPQARQTGPQRRPEPGAGMAREGRGPSGRSLRRRGAGRAQAIQRGGNPPRGAGTGYEDRTGRTARRCAGSGGAGLAARRRSGAGVRSFRSGREPATERSRSAGRSGGSGRIGGISRQGRRRSRSRAENGSGPRRCADLPRLGQSRSRSPRSGARRYREGARASRRIRCRRCSNAAISAGSRAIPTALARTGNASASSPPAARRIWRQGPTSSISNPGRTPRRRRSRQPLSPAD